MSWKRHLLVGLLRLLFRLFTHWEINGQEHLPQGGPLIIVFNHIAHLDGPLVIASMPWEVEAIALSDLYDVPIVGQLLRLYGVISVRRDEYDRQVLRRALSVLNANGVLALAPEARQSPTLALERGRKGAAYLALHSGAPLLPVGLTGTETVFSALKHLRRPHLTVNIGVPFQLAGPLARGAERRVQLEAAREEIMRRIAVLLPIQYRGIYA